MTFIMNQKMINLWSLEDGQRSLLYRLSLENFLDALEEDAFRNDPIEYKYGDVRKQAICVDPRKIFYFPRNNPWYWSKIL